MGLILLTVWSRRQWISTGQAREELGIVTDSEVMDRIMNTENNLPFIN